MAAKKAVKPPAKAKPKAAVKDLKANKETKGGLAAGGPGGGPRVKPLDGRT